jgi:hypothetical protein
MAKPTITPMQTPFPDKGQSQAAFDYNVDGLMNLFDSMTTELPIALDWIEDRVNEVAATAIGGDLPDITGQATNMIRLNAAGDAAEFRTPAQVVQDLGSGTAGRAVFASETPSAGRTALELSDGATAPKATQTEAEAGADTSKYMTPKTTKDALIKHSPYTEGAVGTYTFARHTTDNYAVAFGETVSGLTLRPTSASSEGAEAIGGTLTGVWRCMGQKGSGTNNATNTTLWLRIS